MTDTGSGKPVFIGIAPSTAVQRYLAGTAYATVTDLSSGSVVVHQGSGLPGTPESVAVWTAQSSGPGTQTVTWPDQAGDWTVVVMNADGSAGVDVRAEAGATVPALNWFAWLLLIIGAASMAAAVALVAVPVSRASRELSPTGQGEH